MRAAVGERVERLADPIETDAVGADLEDPHWPSVGASRRDETGLRRSSPLRCRYRSEGHGKAEELARSSSGRVPPFLGRQLPKCLLGLVEIPVRKSLAYISVSHGRRTRASHEVRRVLGGLERLRGEADVLPDVSEGRRRHHGISVRQDFQLVSRRHRKPTKGRAASTMATRARGKRSKMPWQRIDTRCPYIRSRTACGTRRSSREPAAVTGPAMPTPSKWVWTATGSAELVNGLPDRVVDRVAVWDACPSREEHANELVRSPPA